MSFKYEFKIFGNSEISNMNIENLVTLAGKTEQKIDDLINTDGEINIRISKLGDVSKIVANCSDGNLVFGLKNVLKGSVIDDSSPITFTAGTFDVNGETITVPNTADFGLSALAEIINTAGVGNGFTCEAVNAGTSSAYLKIIETNGGSIVIDNVITAVLSEAGLTAATLAASRDMIIPIKGLLVWDMGESFYSDYLRTVSVSTESLVAVDMYITIFGEV